MQMEVMMAVEVIEAEPGPTKRRYLGADLGLRLRARSAAEEDAHALPNRISRKEAVGADQIRNLLGRQCGPAVHQHEMETDAEPRQAVRALDGVFRRGRGLATHDSARSPLAARANGLTIVPRRTLALHLWPCKDWDR